MIKIIHYYILKICMREFLEIDIGNRVKCEINSSSFLGPDISESLLQLLGYLLCKNISAECREWGSGGELRKLHQLPKAVDTKLVSRPRIHAETTQGAGPRAGGGFDCLPSEWKFWRLRVAASWSGVVLTKSTQGQLNTSKTLYPTALVIWTTRLATGDVHT